MIEQHPLIIMNITSTFIAYGQAWADLCVEHAACYVISAVQLSSMQPSLSLQHTHLSFSQFLFTSGSRASFLVSKMSIFLL